MSDKNGNALVVFTCPKGHPCTTGFLKPLASTFRLCGVIVGFDREMGVEHCNAVMVVAYDERPHVEGPLSLDASEAEKRLRMATALTYALNSLRGAGQPVVQIVTDLGKALRGMGQKRTGI